MWVLVFMSTTPDFSLLILLLVPLEGTSSFMLEVTSLDLDNARFRANWKKVDPDFPGSNCFVFLRMNYPILFGVIQ